MKLFVFAAVIFFAAVGSVAAFELETRVYPADETVTLRIRATSKWALDWIKKSADFTPEMLRRTGKNKVIPPVGQCFEEHSFSTKAEYNSRGYPAPLKFKIDGNEIIVTVQLKGENFHKIVFAKPPVPEQKRPDVRWVKVMTLEKEAFKLRPFKGNLHQHSNVSDGRFEPEKHTAYARIAGFDYFGLSDHRKYEQNPKVIAVAADSRCGLTVYPAEELHTPASILHGLSIGASKAHSYSGKRTPAWMKEVQPILEELAAKYPKHPREQMLAWAESILLARRAKADGALTVYCHPSWVPRFSRNNTVAMAECLMQRPEFDAVEIVNGSMNNKSRRENCETLAMFHEICVKTGSLKAVMSSSDSHNVASPSYARNYNVIFAPDCTFPSFKEAYLNGRAVAAYDIDPTPAKNKPQPLFFGTSSYVRYANFLDEVGYWKRHDEVARKQGELLLKYFAGDETVVPQIVELAEEINRIREALYYRSGK